MLKYNTVVFQICIAVMAARLAVVEPNSLAAGIYGVVAIASLVIGLLDAGVTYLANRA